MCNHLRTELQHKVIRLTDEGKPDSFVLKLKLKCLDCITYFTFRTPKMGLLPDEPTTGFDKSELRVPLTAPDPVTNN